MENPGNPAGPKLSSIPKKSVRPPVQVETPQVEKVTLRPTPRDLPKSPSSEKPVQLEIPRSLPKSPSAEKTTAPPVQVEKAPTVPQVQEEPPKFPRIPSADPTTSHHVTTPSSQSSQNVQVEKRIPKLEFPSVPTTQDLGKKPRPLSKTIQVEDVPKVPTVEPERAVQSEDFPVTPNHVDVSPPLPVQVEKEENPQVEIPKSDEIPKPNEISTKTGSKIRPAPPPRPSSFEEGSSTVQVENAPTVPKTEPPTPDFKKPLPTPPPKKGSQIRKPEDSVQVENPQS
eukprot:TRINITY_DN2311_c0_g1_i4.p1 TRINITY_DN2311_c0_g1~~TRINITY_DN2311_c0_g1_i4.p1  ORF type:complete len:284 (-),score=169.91 TRINITY_DN2311_c0_g1_i4:24-875(-)